MSTHAATGRPMMEVLDDGGTLIAAIYPVEGDNSIHIVSKYFADEPFKPSIGSPTGYIAQFDGRDK